MKWHLDFEWKTRGVIDIPKAVASIPKAIMMHSPPTLFQISHLFENTFESLGIFFRKLTFFKEISVYYPPKYPMTFLVIDSKFGTYPISSVFVKN